MNKVAVRIGFDQHIVAVAAPDYSKPQRKPRTPNDLMERTCVNLRLPTPNVREGYTLRSSRGSPAS